MSFRIFRRIAGLAGVACLLNFPLSGAEGVRLMVRDGRIVFVGAAAAARRAGTGVRVLDLKGRTVLTIIAGEMVFEAK